MAVLVLDESEDEAAYPQFDIPLIKRMPGAEVDEDYCDEYLREAASLPNAPSGTVYKQDGKPVEQSLGLFEHWNKDHQYKKIDLRYKKVISEK